jgi:hypothetical protein
LTEVEAVVLATGSRIERIVARAVLSLWFPAVLVVCAYLLGGHVLTLPSPTSDNPRLANAVAALREPEASNRWIVLHVLYQDCRCSGRVLDHLLSRGAEAGARERIVFVRTRGSAGEGDEGAITTRIAAAGFDLDVTSADQLASRYGIPAAPLLVVSDPAGKVRYVGGYTDRKQSPVIRDQEIMGRLRNGERVETLPVFGCAVSAELDRSVDPFGLRH